VTLTKRQRLAWLLVKQRIRVMLYAPYWPQRLRTRDVAGSALADLVALVRISLIALTDHPTEQTEIERRAVVCSRNRLLRRQHEKSN